MTKYRMPQRTLALGLLFVVVVTGVPVTNADDPAVAADDSAQFPYAELVKSSFATAGVTLTAAQEARIEALGTMFDETLEDLVEERESASTWGWLEKLLGIGMEGCTGEGSCGGSYTIDNHSRIYYQEGVYQTSNVCNNSTFVNVILANSGDVKICYAPQENKFCIEGECQDLSPAQSSGVALPAPLEPQPTAPVDADVYLGISQCVWVLSEYSLDPECRPPF